MKYKTAYNIMLTTLLCAFLSINSFIFNPIYIVFFIILIFIAMFILISGKINIFSLFTIYFALLFFLFQILGMYFTDKTVTYVGGINILSPLLMMCSILISIGISESINKLKEIDRIKIYKNTFTIAIIFFLIEFTTRLVIGDNNKEFIYKFKDSLFYFDSNFTGLVIMSMLFLIAYLNIRFNYKSKLNKFIFFMLGTLTFSRAVIITMLIGSYVFNNKEKYKRRSIFICFSGLTLFLFLVKFYIFNGINYKLIDNSFNSKFYIIEKIINFYNHQSIGTKLFGIGLGNSEKIIGIFAHNIFTTFFFEMGVIGSFFLFFIFIYL
ncbi:hypothetical protein [Candidatus Fukatsuia anoeciicola]|uniref:hypothetical protein n=1 Tax=Candidatus Fukatsuia anoeciicola TaxID=2994492 RepID=UPI003463A63C